MRKVVYAMSTKNYLISGVTDLLVLFFLEQKDCYVYEITKAISDLSDGGLVISQNTVYAATYKLENDGMISEYTRLVGKRRTRVYYRIEEKGRAYLREMLLNYRMTVSSIEKILSEKCLSKKILSDKVKDSRNDEND